MPANATEALNATFLLVLLPTVLVPLANAMTLSREGTADTSICKCDFTSALLTLAGKQNEEFSLLVETDGQLSASAPEIALSNNPTRIFLSVACGASEGEHVFQITATSLQSGAVEKKLFSLRAVACPQLVLRRIATNAYCPSQANFELELENVGLTSEKGEFSAQVVEGSAEFTPARFSLAPGEAIPVTLSVGVPTRLLSQASSQEIVVKAIGTQTTASTTVTLTLPLCSTAPQTYSVVPSPTPVILAGGLGSVSGENFITGFLVAGRDRFGAWLSGLRNTPLELPAKGFAQNPLLVAALVTIALLLIAGYAYHTDRQAKHEEAKFAEKRRERMRKMQREI